MPTQLVLIRQTSALRQIGEEEVVAALDDGDQRLGRTLIEVPTAQFADAVEQGDWTGHDYFLREQAGKIRAAADARGDAVIHFFGLAEVPHMIALGAHVGDERKVVVHDQDRKSGSWRWPEVSETLKLVTSGLENLKTAVTARGVAVLRVAISSVISDSDVRAVVGDEKLADVTVGLAEGLVPTYGLVRSAADVDAIRLRFREAFAALKNARPNIETVHLFVAAPPSVCFAVGQELTLRNSPPVQTYRHRKMEGESSQKAGILLSPAGEEVPLLPLTADEVHLADRVRTTVWRAALDDVQNYSAVKRENGDDRLLWYESLEPKAALSLAEPFPTLPPIAGLVPQGVSIDPVPFNGDYGYQANGKVWRLGDRLLLGLNRAVEGDEAKLRQLIRLFLFHEYLHLYHSIGKHTAAEVGKFANCLEHIDYTADTYALLHQLDWTRSYERQKVATDEQKQRFLAEQIDLALLSFWAFDEAAGNEWQVRRIRRYLNWYWRLVQIENAPDLKTAMLLFNRQPRIEIGGLYQLARGRRILAQLNRRDPTTHLELALVLEDEKLHRQSDSPNTNLSALLDAFQNKEHDAIKAFFRGLFDMAKDKEGVLPIPRERDEARRARK